MRRSQINEILKDAVAFFKEMNFILPPFAYWSKKDHKEGGREYDEIRRAMLGWDITDFGSGDFEKKGLLLFTLRNGYKTEGKTYSKPYAEKIMIVRPNQVTPFHFHYYKTEDIINRGGGDLVITVYNSDARGGFSSGDVTVLSDGRKYSVRAGTDITLNPGQSITLIPGLYHEFRGVGKKVLVGEVSLVNDDKTDNRFYEEAGRFPSIVEDEEPLYILVGEYGG